MLYSEAVSLSCDSSQVGPREQAAGGCKYLPPAAFALPRGVNVDTPGGERWLALEAIKAVRDATKRASPCYVNRPPAYGRTRLRFFLPLNR